MNIKIPIRKQSGVIAYRETESGTQVMLITHMGNKKKWGIPKGGHEPHLTAKKNAEKEAYEEAGILGKAKKLLGVFNYVKKDGKAQTVKVYKMKVKDVLPNYPEKEKRERKWFSIVNAKKRIPKDLHPMLDLL